MKRSDIVRYITSNIDKSIRITYIIIYWSFRLYQTNISLPNSEDTPCTSLLFWNYNFIFVPEHKSSFFMFQRLSLGGITVSLYVNSTFYLPCVYCRTPLLLQTLLLYPGILSRKHTYEYVA